MNRVVEVEELAGAEPVEQRRAQALVDAPQQDERWELPKDWLWARLGDVLPLSYGKALPERVRDNSGHVPVFGSAGLAGFHSIALAPANSVIVGRKGNAGAVHRSLVPCWPIDTAYFTIGTPAIDMGFGYWFLIFCKLGSFDQSTAIPSLSRDIYNRVYVPLPPLAEQQRIVARIDALFAEIANGETALKAAQDGLDTFRRALLKAAVTGALTADWRETNHPAETGHDLLERVLERRRRRLQDSKPGRGAAASPPIDTSALPSIPENWAWGTLAALSDIVGGATVDQKRRPVDPVTVPYIRVANVQRGRLDLSKIKYITVERTAATKLRLESNDLLFNEGGDRDKIGRGWAWEQGPADTIHQNHVFRARILDADFSAHFMSHYANEMGRRYFIEQGKQTTNLASISLSKISALPVPIPPPAETTEILRRVSDALNALDDTRVMLDAEAANTVRLRQAVLKAAFAGRLVPQDPTDEPASELLARIAAETNMRPARRGRRAAA